MSIITINGKTILANGNIIISNGRVVVNGIDVTPAEKEINISVSGNIEKLEVDACSKLSITGDVSNVKTASGDIEISGNVNGNIQTMSGDIDCGNVGGSISTMSGSIKKRN